jgi:hypothetical protein
MMGEDGSIPTQRLVEQNLAGRIGKMIISPYHMGDIHKIIIDNAGKIIGRHRIGPDDDEIADSFSIEVHSAMNEVFKNNRASLHMKPEYRLLTFGFQSHNVTFRERPAFAIISWHLPFGELFFPKRLEPFRGAEAFVSLALAKQPICMLMIEFETLRLTIRARRSAPVRPFFPLDSEPSQIFQDMVNRGVVRMLHVGVFNPEDKRPTMVFGKKVVEKGSSSISDVEKTRWGWSESDTNRWGY